MPISVEIKINEKVIRWVHISRMAGMSIDPDSVNEYSVVSYTELDCYGKTPEPEWVDYLAGVHFTHRYGDGAEVLVQHALKALQTRVAADDG